MHKSTILTNAFAIIDYEITTFRTFFFSKNFQLSPKQSKSPKHAQDNEKDKEKCNYFNHHNITN